MTAEELIGSIDAAVRELALFAAAGFLIGGLDDLLVDLIWIVRSLWRRATVYRRHSRADMETLSSPPEQSGHLAIFVPAWQEEAVIGAMVFTTLTRIRHVDWRLYVGCYPNDRATIRAVQSAAGGDPRVRLIVGDVPGPTTKAGCLNSLWRAMLADEQKAGRRVKAVVLHDAEDVVHADELTIYDALIERFDLVQIPVEPLVVRGAGLFGALVSGHYCGEFAEAHGKQIVVREAIGAAVPSAGVGCAISRATLGQIATHARGPFDPDSLTEDYELGLRIGAAGGRGVFVRLPAADGHGPVAVRACFPAAIDAAVRQKGRWVTGIALAGWDRLGWEGGIAERWMRLRDRRAPLAAIVLAAAYGALLGWGLGQIAALLTGQSSLVTVPPSLLLANIALLIWRMAMRAGFTARSYGWRMAMLTPIHMVIGNIVAMMAAVRALRLYFAIVGSGRVRWDKTAHVFPGSSQ